MEEDYMVIKTPQSWMYRNKNKTICAELLEVWINFILFYIPLSMVIYGLNGERAMYEGFMFFLGVLIIVYSNRNISDNKLFFGVNSLIILIGCLLFPYNSQKIVYAAMLIPTFLKYFKSRSKENVSFMGMGSMLLNAGVLASSFVVSSNMEWQPAPVNRMITILAVIDIICLLIYYHITRRDVFLTWEEDYANMLAKHMKKVSNYVIVFLTVFISLVSIVLWKSGALSLMDSLFHGFSFNAGTVTPPVKVENVSKSNTDNPLSQMNPGSYSNNVLKIITTVFIAVIIIISSIVIIYFLWRAVLNLKDIWHVYFGKKSNGKEKREFVFDKAPESRIITKVKELKRNLEENFKFSNRKKIRGFYKKFVKKYKHKGIEPERYNTAGELQNKIELLRHESCSEVTEIYHKARYGKEECTDEDVLKIRKYL